MTPPTLETLRERLRGVYAYEQKETPSAFAQAVRASGLSATEIATLLDEVPHVRSGHAVKKCEALRDALRRIHDEALRVSPTRNQRRTVSEFLELDEKPIAEGASGRVYGARLIEPRYGLATDTRVAVKLFKHGVLARPHGIERLRREVKIGQSLSHPHLVRIHGLIEPLSPEGEHAVVMELVLGRRLSEVVRGGVVDRASRLAVAHQIALAVDAMHVAKCFHRDIKTDNIVIRPDGSAALVDYGVSRDIEDSTFTASQEFLGTLRFASPQWLEGKRFEAADDVYALGVVYYELFLERLLFEEVTNKALLADAIRGDVPEILSEWHGSKDCPYYLRVLIQKMLAKAREERPSISEVVERLGDPRAASYVRELERFHKGHQGAAMESRVDPADANSFEAVCTECGAATLLSFQELRELHDMAALSRSLRKHGSVTLWLWCGSCETRHSCHVSVA